MLTMRKHHPDYHRELARIEQRLEPLVKAASQALERLKRIRPDSPDAQEARAAYTAAQDAADLVSRERQKFRDEFMP
jgi:hypothetical protein